MSYQLHLIAEVIFGSKLCHTICKDRDWQVGILFSSANRLNSPPAYSHLTESATSIKQ